MDPILREISCKVSFALLFWMIQARVSSKITIAGQLRVIFFFWREPGGENPCRALCFRRELHAPPLDRSRVGTMAQPNQGSVGVSPTKNSPLPRPCSNRAAVPRWALALSVRCHVCCVMVLPQLPHSQRHDKLEEFCHL